jgi:hypothetical protein
VLSCECLLIDKVDRHVRILDQAITEQETSISLGARPSHLAPSSLPELVVPRWGRPSRTTLSPVDEDDEDLVFSGAAEYPGQLLDKNTSEAHALRRSGKRGRRGRHREGSLLTITLPPSSDGPASREQLFCYCNGTSSGKVGSRHPLGVPSSDTYSIRWLLATTKSARLNG